ncbi:MAG: hypothetical protein IT373_02775 [Polyangiaceae bacterium]|nr:hypothetical protein [Polyangiaceae bacterium]
MLAWFRRPWSKQVTFWLLACASATAVAIILMSATGQDDSHITYWAAKVLADHGEIVNHSGDRVEQSSSLLLTLILACAYKLLPFAIPTLGYVAGIVFGWLAVRRVASCGSDRFSTHPLLAPLAAITSPLLCYWMLSGMETTLVAWLYVSHALEVSQILDGRRRVLTLRVALLAFAVAAVRPETAFVCMAADAGLVFVFALRRLRFARRRTHMHPRWPRLVALLAIHLGAVACVVLFRIVYFHSAFPQPVAAKSGPVTGAVVLGGLKYLWNQLTRVDMVALLCALVFSTLAAAIALFARRRVTVLPVVVSALVLAHGALVVAVGGDWMAVGRFVALAAPLLSILAIWAIQQVFERCWLRRVALSALVVCNGLGLLKVAMKEAPGRPLWIQLQSDSVIQANATGFDFPWVDRANQTHTRDALFAGELADVVRDILAYKRPVVIMSGQAGMVMYYVASRYFGRVRFIDRHGLTTRDLMRAQRELGLGVASTGLVVSTDQFLALAASRPEDDLMPDVIFDIAPDRRKAAERLGYVCVYEQTGRMSASSPEGPGPRQAGPRRRASFTVQGGVYQFVAIRREIAKLLGVADAPPRKLEWNPVPTTDARLRNHAR